MSTPLPPLPARDPQGHKGTFGTACVIGGQISAQRVMVGGPALGATAALRSGAGLAVLAVPAPLAAAALSISPCATAIPLPIDDQGRLRPAECAELLDPILARARCVAIGPGLGVDEPQRQIVMRLLAREDLRLIVDADALNCLAATESPQLDLRAAAVLTPHPGEYLRLAAAIGLPTSLEGDAQRRAAATALAQRLGCIVVLKGRGTIVADGLESWICSAGNAALATGGSGDVLTGVIAGLIVQHGGSRNDQLSLYDCARLAVEAHARAADAWLARGASAGMLATDLLELLPGALESLRGG